jgi:hypothetical protein
MADGFLGRWAKRKEAVRKGEEVAPEPVVEAAPPSSQPSPASGRGSAETPSPGTGEGGGEGAPVAEPPPTLDDVATLTKDSDFSRYVRSDVGPEVRNAAMKKLFADPHFNVMDRLDTYIDDYGKPDPIPPAMLRQLASARFLNLFDDEDEEGNKKAPTAREVANDPTADSVAQSGTAASIPPAVPPAEDHADPDLRLQQDHAPGRQVPGQGTE